MTTITVDRLITALRRRGDTDLAETIEFEAQSFDEVRWHPVDRDKDWRSEFSD